MALANEIEGQPGNEEIPEIVVGKESGEGAPCGALLEDLQDARASGRFGRCPGIALSRAGANIGSEACAGLRRNLSHGSNQSELATRKL